MKADKVKKTLKKNKLIPIFRTAESETVMPVIDAVVDAGVDVIQLTTTTPDVIKKIEEIRKKYPKMIIGLGTVLKKSYAKNAIKAGADFIVSPILNINLVDTVKSHDILLVLSAFTPTEIYQASQSGADLVKLFPASQLHPQYIQELKQPFPDLEIYPNGGLNLISGIQYLSYGAVVVGLGKSLFVPDYIRQKRYDLITKRVENARQRIQNMEI